MSESLQLHLLFLSISHVVGILSGYIIGWLVFNSNFSTNRLYCAMSTQEINPITYLLQTDGLTMIQTPVLPLSKQVL